MERGFKTWAENLAEGLRRDLGIAAVAPIDLAALAESLSVKLLTPRDIRGLSRGDLDWLLVRDPSGWSAASVSRNGEPQVIYNPMHSEGRRSSDIAHEIAHLVLGHEPGMIVLSQDGEFVMRSFAADQEEEANWLAWCILLPRRALAHCIRSRMTVTQIAQEFRISETLVRFRIRLTGISRQYRVASKASRATHSDP